jgi:hypothetical protein
MVLSNALDNNQQYGMVSSDFKIFGDREENVIYQKPSYTLDDMKVGNFVGASFMFRKSISDKIGKFDADMITVEDWDYWTKISQYTPILKVRGIYVWWRSHKDNMSSTIAKQIGFQQEAKLKNKYKDQKSYY